MTEAIKGDCMALDSRGSSIQDHTAHSPAPRTFPGRARGWPIKCYPFPFARVAGAIGLLLMGGCGGLPQRFASEVHAEPQHQVELQQKLQRLEQEQRRLDGRQRRLEQQVRRLGGQQRALVAEQRLLKVERRLSAKVRRLEQEQRRY